VREGEDLMVFAFTFNREVIKMPSKEDMDIIRKAAELDPAFAARIMNFPVNVQKGKIAVPTGIATITGSITSVDIVNTSGQIVTSLSAGDHFDCYVHFDITNPGGGNWTIGVTVTSPDGTNQHFDLFSAENTNHVTTAFNIRDAINSVAPFIMPAAALSLRVTPWAYPYSWPSGASGFLSAVPKSQW
jgi:hypothetical protein